MRTGATDTGAGFGIGFYATENEATMVRDGLLAVETITLSDGSSHSLEPILLTKEFLQSKAAFIRNLPNKMSCAELKEMLETFTLEHEVHDIFIKASQVEDQNCGFALLHFEHHYQVFAMVNDLNGESFGDKSLSVEWLSSSEQHTLEAHLSRLKKRVYNSEEAKKTVILANLPSDLTSSDLASNLESLSQDESSAFISADIFMTSTGKSFGFGVIVFGGEITAAKRDVIVEAVSAVAPDAIAMPLLKEDRDSPVESAEVIALKQQLAHAAEAEAAAKAQAEAAAAEAAEAAQVVIAQAKAESKAMEMEAVAAKLKAEAAAAEAAEAAEAAIAQAKAEADAMEAAAAAAQAEAEETANAAAQAIEDLKAKGDADAAAAAEAAALRAKAEAEAAAAEAAAQAAAATQKAEAEAAAANAAAAKAKQEAEALAEASRIQEEKALAEAAKANEEAEAMAAEAVAAAAAAKSKAEAEIARVQEEANMAASAKTIVKPSLTREASERARSRWRKAIRAILRNNKMKKLKLGLMKAKTGKGQSVMERMKRLEDRIYDELVRLQTILKENDAGDKATRNVIEKMHTELSSLSSSLKSDYALKVEISQAKEQVLSQLLSESDRFLNVQKVQAMVRKSRVIALSDAIDNSVKDTSVLATDVDRILNGTTPENLKMDSSVWLQSDWGLRECRQRFAELKTKAIIARQELTQLKDESRGWVEVGDTNESEITKTLEDLEGSLSSFEDSLGVGTALHKGLSRTLLSFDQTMRKEFEVNEVFGAKASMHTSDEDSGVAFDAMNKMLNEKVDKSEYEKASATVEGRVDEVQRMLSLTSVQMNDQLVQIQSTEEKTMDLKENISKLRADMEHEKKNRGSNIERLVKKFIDIYVSKMNLSENEGFNSEALEEFDRKLKETASELRQAVELR